MKQPLFYLLRSVSLLFIIFAAGNEESVTIISNQTIFMNNQYIRLLLAVVLCVVTSCSTTRQLPVRETEGKRQTGIQGSLDTNSFPGRI